MKNFSISRRHFLYLFCLLNLLYLPRPAGAQGKPTSYAVTHAKIFTLSGGTIDDGTLLIRDGKIFSVGAAVEVPAGAQVIDAKGLQVYPGLFDPITQMGLSEISAVPATVDSAETGPFNPDVVAAEAILPSSEHISVTRAAGITEVLAVPDAHLHLYGKSPRPGRKLGHVTLRAASPERLALRLSELPAFFHRPDFCLDAALAPSAHLRA